MGIGEPETAHGEFIDVGSLDQAAIAAVDVGVTDSQVVGEDEDDVGALDGVENS